VFDEWLGHIFDADDAHRDGRDGIRNGELAQKRVYTLMIEFSKTGRKTKLRLDEVLKTSLSIKMEKK
jgi:hypothetical protein